MGIRDNRRTRKGDPFQRKPKDSKRDLQREPFDDFDALEREQMLTFDGVVETPEHENEAPDHEQLLTHGGFSFGRITITHEDETSVDVTPDDPRVAAVTAEILHTLGRAFGVNLDHVQIVTDAEAGRHTDARRAHGVYEDGAIYLHPDAYNPDTKAGQQLIAHEAAHAAQAELHADDSAVDAEIEAAQIAETFAQGEIPDAPTVALPYRASAADTDAPAAQVKNPVQDLQQTVATQYVGEIREIERLLSGKLLFFSYISDADVTRVMIVLQPLEFVVVVGIISALSADKRVDLVDNIDDAHYARFRREILASYQALTPNEIYDEFDEDLLDEMNLGNLSDPEAFAVAHVVNHLKESAWQALYRSRNRPVIEEIIAYTQTDAAQQNYKRETEAEAEKALKRIKEETKERERLAGLVDADKGIQDTIAKIKERLDKTIVWDSDAIAALDLIVQYQDHTDKLDAIALRLETEGYLDKLIDQLPIKSLYDESTHRRTVFARLLKARPAYKNAALAEDLIDDPWYKFWDPVTSEDAFLAYELVRAMPEGAQSAFIAGREEAWEAILDNLTQSARDSRRFNLYGGGKNDEDRNNLLTQLLDETVWTPENAQRLDGLIRMAIVAGEYEWVFNRSKKNPYYADETLKPIIEKYLLYNPDAVDENGKPAPRNEYQPEKIKSRSFLREGFVGVLTDLLTLPITIPVWLYKGIRLLVAASPNIIFTKFDVDLNTVQGQLKSQLQAAGVTLSTPEDLQGEGDASGGGGANQLRVETNFHWKKLLDKITPGFADIDDMDYYVNMSSDRLELAALNMMFGANKLNTGRGTITGLELEASHSANDHAKVNSIKLQMGAFNLRDITLVRPNSIMALNEANVTRFDLRGQQVSVNLSGFPQAEGVEEYAVLLSGISQSLMTALNAPEMGTQFNLSIGSVKLEGLTTSGGGYIELVELGGVSLNLAANLGAYQQALQASKRRLSDLIPQANARVQNATDAETRAQAQAGLTRLQEQQAAVTDALNSLNADQRRYEELEAKQRAYQQDGSKTPFTNDDQAELHRLRARLASYAGIVLDIRSVKIVHPQSDQPIQIDNVHGQGQLNAGFLSSLLGDSSGELLTGGRPQAVISSQAARGEFILDVGNVALPQLTLDSAFPTVEDVKKSLEKARERLQKRPYDPSLKREVERLERLKTLIPRYHELRRKGVRNLSDGETKEYLQLREDIQALGTQTKIGPAKLVGTRIVITGTSERTAIGVRVREFGTEFEQGALKIEQLEGRNVTLGIEVGAGLTALGDTDKLREQLEKISLSGDSLTARGVTQPGTTVKEITFQVFDAGVENIQSGDAEATFTSKALIVRGVTLQKSVELMTAERDYLTKVVSELAPDDDTYKAKAARLKTLNDALSQLDTLEQTLSAAKLKQAAADSDEAQEAAQAEVDAAQAALDAWFKTFVADQIVINDVDARVFRLGDLTDADADLIADMQRRGIRITAGKSGQLFSGGEITGLTTGGATVAKTTLGALSGQIFYSEDKIEFTDLVLGSIRVEGLNWRGGSKHVYSTGSATLEPIRLSATIDFTPDKVHGEKKASKVTFHEFRIGTMSASGLHYEDSASDLKVEVQSGALGGLSFEPGLTLDLTAEDMLTQGVRGKVSLESIDALKIAGSMGSTIQRFSGQLDAKDLSIDFADDGTQRIHIGDLDLTNGRIVTASGRLRVDVRNVSGDITQSGNTTTLKGFEIGDVQVSRVNWKAGTATITATEGVIVRNIVVDLTMVSEEKPDPKDPSKTITERKVTISELKTGMITGNGITYTDGTTVIRIEQPAGYITFEPNEQENALYIASATLKNLHWSTSGGLEDFQLTTGRAKTGFVAEFGADFARGEISADSLSLALRKGNEYVGSAKQLAAVGDVSFGGFQTAFSTGAFDTGEFTFADGKLVIPGMHIPEIQLAFLHFHSPKAGTVSMPDATSGIQLTGIDVGIEVTLNQEKPPPSSTVKPPPFKELRVTKFKIAQITGNGLKYVDPSGGIEVTLPEDKKVTLTNLYLDGTAFVVKPPAAAGGSYSLDGKFALDKYNVERLSASVKDTMTADATISGETLTFEAFESGGFKVTNALLSLTDIEGKLKGSPFTLKRLTASGINYNSTSGDVGVDKVSAGEFTFDSADGNIHLTVAGADLPLKTTYSKSANKVTVPKVTFSNANIVIDDVMKLSSGGGGGESDPIKTFTLFKLNSDFLDRLNGHIRMNIVGDINAPYIHHINTIDDETFSVDMQITDGKFNLKQFEHATLNGWVDSAVDLDVEDNELVVGITWHGTAREEAESLDPTYNAKTLANLPDDEVQDYDKTGRIRLKTLVLGVWEGVVTDTSEDEGGPEFFHIDSINGIDIDLGLKGPNRFAIPDVGVFTLGTNTEDGFVHLKVNGDLTNNEKLTFSLEKLKAGIPYLDLGAAGSLEVKSLEINGVTGGSLTFVEDRSSKIRLKPQRFEATITGGSAEQIFFTPKKK